MEIYNSDSVDYAEFCQQKSAQQTLIFEDHAVTMRAMDIGAAIRSARKAKKWTLEELSNRVGTDTGNLSRLERNKQGASRELLAKIFSELGISLEPAATDAIQTNVALGNTNVFAGGWPILSWVSAGQLCHMAEVVPPQAAEYAPGPPRPEGGFALRVEGDSMTAQYPGARSYPHGSIILVDPNKEVTNGCRVIACIPESEEAVFKTYVQDSGRAFLKPINPQYPTYEIHDGVHILGVVVGMFIPE